MHDPPWLDRQVYPFTSHYLSLPAGRMHYVDAGEGEVLLMVHGNPEWSFAYRKVIQALQHQYRCVAPDHLGFGLSDKPTHGLYLPQDHAQRLSEFITALDLRNITLVVNDWGGPTGLAYALHHPENVKRLVIINTWCWPVDQELYYQLFSGLMGSRLGKWLIRRHNFFLRVIVPAVIGRRKAFPPHVMKQYHQPLATPKERQASAILPGQIVRASDWLQSLWERRAAIRDKPALIFWGMKDLGFREKELGVWEQFFSHKKVVRLPEVGHFPHEEAAEELAEELKRWMVET